MLPAADGLSTTLHRHLRARRRRAASSRSCELRLDGSAHDSLAAVARDARAGASRRSSCSAATARTASSPRPAATRPICAISTGTNNAFPDLRETTVAGLATGYVATGAGQNGLRREYALEVRVGERTDIALVDVAISRARFIGARALWRPEGIAELFVTFANPSAVGLSAIAGALQPLPRGGGQGLHVRLGEGRARRRRARPRPDRARGRRRARDHRARRGGRRSPRARSPSTASASSNAPTSPRPSA